jgi:D-lactate dehydrogenase
MRIAFFSEHAFQTPFLIEANREYGHELVFFKEQLSRRTAQLAAGFVAVCPFVTDKLDAETLRILADGGTKLIALRSAGFNNLDLAAAERLGLCVMRVPAYAPTAIAEHAVALMLALNRRINHAYNRVREGNFSLDHLVGFNMEGRTVGIVGTGKIGESLARIMHGFGCHILGYDIYQNPACIALGMKYVDLPTLLSESDIVSLHCPLTPETKHLINEETLKLMKPGSMLINTARGGLVNAEAVIEALKRKDGLAYVGMDVYEREEGLFFSDHSSSIIQDDVFELLTTMRNVIVTGHQAFLTREALAEIAHTTLGNVADYERGTPNPKNVLSAGVEGPGGPLHQSPRE